MFSWTIEQLGNMCLAASKLPGTINRTKMWRLTTWRISRPYFWDRVRGKIAKVKYPAMVINFPCLTDLVLHNDLQKTKTQKSCWRDTKTEAMIIMKNFVTKHCRSCFLELTLTAHLKCIILKTLCNNQKRKKAAGGTITKTEIVKNFLIFFLKNEKTFFPQNSCHENV